MSFNIVQSSSNASFTSCSRASALLLCALTLVPACKLESDSQTPMQTPASSAAGSGAAADAGAAGDGQATADETGHVATHADDADYLYSAGEVVEITLGRAFQVSANAGSSVTLDGTTATITAPGSYRLRGSASEGQIRVSSNGVVRLLLGGMELASSSSAPLAILAADKAVILVEDGTRNSLSQGASGTDEQNAALYSAVDLTVHGNGVLSVSTSYADGISSKAGLVIDEARLEVTAVDDAIRGKDYLTLTQSQLALTAGGDGLKSDNTADMAHGFISVDGGGYTIRSGADALQAASDLLIRSGTFDIQTGGGSQTLLAADASAKGLKAKRFLTIDSGTFALDTADDAIHSNAHLTIDAGDFTIQAGDDGLHAEASLTINGGTLDIVRSTEGLESASILLNGGKLRVVSSDDGVNVSAGEDASGAVIAANHLWIDGSSLYVDSAGDGLDANASISMQSGTVIVEGPTAQDNAAIDYDGSFELTGGTLIAVGSAGMAQAPSASSTQLSLKVTYGTATGSGARGMGMGFAAPGAGSGATLVAGTPVRLETSDGEELLTFTPQKDWSSLVYSSPALVRGLTGNVYTGGTASGSQTDGLYEAASYTDGTLRVGFTLSSAVTEVSFQ